ncbi:MAG: CoA activase [Desulfobulbaceae bacterium BRH_c16a]|nr:MAG: CoA activase [Desulfobulbaceae bacterium BRH_c16a]
MTSYSAVLGIDVGSVAAGVAVMDNNRQILFSGYAFHHGDIAGTLTGLLKDQDLGSIRYLAATTSTPSSVKTENRLNNRMAEITAAKRYHQSMRGLLVVGGEKFSFSTFDAEGHYLGSAANTSCAAGTGSFLDQQAGRLKLHGIEELSKIACTCTGKCPQIASRCAVFAKTDLIHAQQEGYQLDEISDGLCHGLAKNIVDTLFSSTKPPQGKIVFCGGVAKNKAVAGHISDLTGLSLTIPGNGHLYGAIGACLLLQQELENNNETIAPVSIETMNQLFETAESPAREYFYPPLQLHLSSYPDFTDHTQYLTKRGENGMEVEVDLYLPLERGQKIEAYLGIDIGSTSTKAAIIDESGDLVAGFYTRTAGRPLMAVQNIFSAIDELQQNNDVAISIRQSGTTGSGRKFIGKLIGADAIIDEITAHARAACHLNPEVDTIIEIGGQDAKFTTLKNGRVTFSTMNNVCAAGTGSFIEEQAAKLGCPVEEYSARAENLRAPMTSDRCTVFMERDMNHFLSEGYDINEVLASALHSVRENYLLKVATENNIGKTILFQGATAKNKALVAAFEQRLQKPIFVSRYCHLTGALGTALILREEKRRESTFTGIDLYKKTIPVASETCELCTNHCKISVATIDSQKVAYGFLCGRDYETRSYVARDCRAIDLLQERKRLRRFQKQTVDGDLTIGLPAAVHLVDDLHLWQMFFDRLGIKTLTSEKYDEALQEGKKLSQSEFCAPMTAMHGHAQWLLDRTDFLFMPMYLENKAKDARRQYCYYTQFLPSLISCMAGQEEHRVLRPIIKYLYTSFHTKMQLYRMLQQIRPGRWNFFEVTSAYDSAVEFDRQYRQNLKKLYSSRKAQQGQADVGVVFVGRPYTLLSPSLNGNIPGIFRNLGVDTFYQDMLNDEPGDFTGLRPLLQEIHWEYAAKIIEAAEIIAATDGIYPVYVTSFKCSPDAFAVEYFKKIMDRHNKPYLILELDGHDSSVGYETRIEAAIRSFKNHREQRPFFLPVDYSTLNQTYAESLAGKHVLFPNWDHITCSLLTATLKREGYDARLLEESDRIIRESLRHNSGQCIPLNVVAQSCINYIKKQNLDPAKCVLWLNRSYLGCNIRLYPNYIRQIFVTHGGGLEHVSVYQGDISFSDISVRACITGYFAYMIGGMLQKIACKIRPYEIESGRTDKTLKKSIKVLSDAFMGKRSIEKTLDEIVSQFEWIETSVSPRPKVAIFGDIYSRDNEVMNQDLVRFIETHGGEVITTPYSEYAKMIAGSYFRKWFNEGKYFNVLTSRALLTTMTAMEKSYARIFNRILDTPQHTYDDDPAEILARYNISVENTGESMDNILKIHYIKKYYPEVSLLVQASPALCCASLITEAMKATIENITGTPVVSITYDGTGGGKNDIVIPYLKYPRIPGTKESRLAKYYRAK